MVPQNLSEVWRRRFGDCKEKSLLLVWLLRELGIKADPVLVNTDMGSGLARWLPSPAVFNHVVVRIDFDGGELWIDPTNTYRGGSPASWKELPFALGLPLKQGADQLIAIPSAEIGTSYLKTREHLKLDSKSRQCELSLEMCFGGMRADWLRGFVDSQGVGGLRKLAESMLERCDLQGKNGGRPETGSPICTEPHGHIPVLIRWSLGRAGRQTAEKRHGDSVSTSHRA